MYKVWGNHCIIYMYIEWQVVPSNNMANISSDLTMYCKLCVHEQDESETYNAPRTIPPQANSLGQFHKMLVPCQINMYATG